MIELFMLMVGPDQPYLVDDPRSLMTAENCQEAADDLNSAEDTDVYFCKPVKVFFTTKGLKT